MLDLIRSVIRPARKQSIFRVERAGASAVPRVFGGLVVCLAVTGLLSSERLVQMADRQEFGPERDRWLAAAEIVHELAAGVGLDRPATAIDSALGRTDGPSEVVLGELTPATTQSPAIETGPPTTPVPPTTETPSAPEDESPAEPTTTAPPTTISEPTTTTTAVLGEVSVNDPLRVWIGGDSLGEYVGSELLYRVADPDMTDVELDFVISTGLARPDYYDWPARLSEVMQRPDRPQVVIFMVGGNDDQAMEVDGERADVGTDSWRAAYARRAATMMDIAAYPDVQVLWINLPPMRDDRREAISVDINAQLEAEAELRPWVQIVDITQLFTGPGGGYDQFLDEPGGDATRKARANDGVHITRVASRWVADIVWDQIGGRWRFDRLTPPTTTTTTAPEGLDDPADE